ncbi:hypothetical protein [Plebeiibacterium marinum]|uniref:Uncharacterized protein n=1 Tax=Plebeiibacterium marinum TaxID=2992111 RepID=A0AAE3MDX7_9BACT|nr:hypothetical protein [Plebeiobacterium marinum]MCW3806081.1 hypothetical protein [Plebeiobacterium marinum]
MKIIKFLFATLLAVAIFSCENDKEEDVQKIGVLPEMDMLIEEYGLSGDGVAYDGCSLGLDTNIIYFNGRMGGRLCIESFDRTNKNNLISWQGSEALQLLYQEDKGYGESADYEISDFGIKKPYRFNGYHAFILEGKGNGLVNEIVSRNLYFISSDNCKKIESLAYPSGRDTYIFYNIIPWYQNHILVLKASIEPGNLDSCFCYSMDGNEMYKLEKSANYLSDKNFIVVDIAKYIEFGDDVLGTFVCNDIINEEEIWESEMPLNDLPEDARIDKIEFSVYDSSSILCKFNYTLYSGETGVRDVVVDTATGVLTKK